MVYMSNAWADWDFNTFTPILWWENSIFHLWYMHSTRHCTWPLSIWKKHSNLSSGGLFTNLALKSDWCYSYRACMKMPEAECVWLQPEWSVKCESGCSPRLLPEPPYCFISGLEALTKEFHTGCPWENLYEDDLDWGFMSFRGLVKTSVLCVPRALA